MPFNSNAGHEFSEVGIEVYARVATGVYGIYSGKQWIYIDDALDIEACLLGYFRGESDQSARVMRERPAYFIFEKCDVRALPERKYELIREYRPILQSALLIPSDPPSWPATVGSRALESNHNVGVQKPDSAVAPSGPLVVRSSCAT